MTGAHDLSDPIPEYPPPAYALSEDGELDYALTSTPFPLMASPPSPGPLVAAELDLVITAAPGKKVTCSRLVIALPRGTQPQSLVESGDGIEVRFSDDSWSAAIAGTEGTVECVLTSEYDFYDFEGETLVVHLRGVGVNRSAGNTEVTVTEHCRLPGDDQDRVTTVRLRNIEKEPFRPAIAAGSPNRFSVHRGAPSENNPAPATTVRAGSTVTLRWRKPEAARQWVFAQYLRSENGFAGKEVTGESTLASDPLNRTTTFTLRTITTATREITDESVTVQVSNPTLAGLTVRGPVGVPASLTLGGDLKTGRTPTDAHGLTVAGQLTATGAATVTDTLTAHQGIAIAGPLTVRGTPTSGASTISGQVTAAAITVRNLTATNSVTLFGPPVKVILTKPNLPFVAQTEGILVVQLLSAHLHKDTLIVEVNAGGQQWSAMLLSNGLNLAPRSDSLLIPLRPGDEVTASGSATQHPPLVSHQSAWLPTGGQA
ncbi:hypothetical protein [Amycolatopsis panacis]|uniref:Uncharacterized protein n=1 Tax=Amycolatopsis panacis TaxID=2340917 RepID=A0A419I267_9PSEU|nr:hypothetical protein [Amycolatopsis panacis]RJQ83878.1 hypothetical protein D5S19_18915 [Amycolatopsis panacis]